ncbi:uncharacterized protein LOC135683755 [Rhopilema esculentum]|uniref:uncharacterized protein LOC135683755 n=1 Tax=Rhopilema esculentum TaxID=499914 RepID=UPI0031E1E15F
MLIHSEIGGHVPKRVQTISNMADANTPVASNNLHFEETLELALDILIDDEDFGSVYDEEVLSVVKEISHDGSLACENCSKKYKTEAGLRRHIKSKHVSHKQTRQFSGEDIVKLVNEAKNELATDKCYPVELCNAIKMFVFDKESENLRTELLKHCSRLWKNSDAEKFYSEYYGSVVMNAEKFFPNLPFPGCTLVATKLADKIVSHFKTPAKQIAVPKKITEQEMFSLQYLAGYVVHSVVKKLHQVSNGQKSKSSIAMLTFLNSLRLEDISAQQQIQCQSRGGLWGVNNDCVRFFSYVEEEFRKATESGHITKINCNKLTEILVERVDVVSSFSAMEEGSLCEMDKETKKNLLEKLIQLYLRVRAFSFAKTNTQLHCKKSKALRKSLKLQGL